MYIRVYHQFVGFKNIVTVLLKTFQKPFECGNRYCCEIPEELKNNLKSFFQCLAEPYDLIRLLTEYVVCEISALRDHREKMR